MITFLLLFAGELAGDASFFLLGARKRGSDSKNYEARKRQYNIWCCSCVIAFCSFLACLAIRNGFNLLMTLFSVNSIPGSTLLSHLPEFLDAVGSLTSVVAFMYFYRKIRETWKDYISVECPEPCEIRDDFWGIYIKDDVSGAYVLSERWEYIKDCIRYILIFNFIMLIVLHFSPVISMKPRSILSFDFLELIPVAASVILLEFFNYLAYDDESFFFPKRRDESQDTDSFNLLKIKVDCERKNVDGLVTSLILRRHSYTVKDEMREFMERCWQDSNTYVQYLGHYLEKRKWPEGRYYHAGCLETAIRLTRGENIFCATPFYKDIDISIFFPVYITLMKGKKALILVEDCGNLDELAAWVKTGIEEVQNLNDFWKVDILMEGGDNTDVGILSFQNIYGSDDFGWLSDFFGHVMFTIVIEASDMLAGGQEAISNLSEKIGREVGGCTWLLCDNNAECMLDLFSHLLNKEFSYVSATPLRAEESMIAYWNVEKENPYPWNPVRRYMGAEILIAEIAWMNSVEKVVWYGEELVPVYDLKWIFGQYYEEFHNRTMRKPQQHIMDEGIEMSIAGNTCKMSDYCFLIVEDSNFNLYETARQYITRASKKAVINIVSPNYMMREFMKKNEKSMYADPKFIAQFVPEFVNTRRNVAVRLMRRMLQQAVPESEIEEELSRCEDWKQEFRGLTDVEELAKLILDTEEPRIRISYHNYFDEKQGGSVRERCYQICSDEIKRQFMRYFQKACYMNEKGEKRHINKLILAGHLDQRYLRGQFAVFNGFYYEVLDRIAIDSEYILQVRRASEQIWGRKYYRQDRCYSLENISKYPSALVGYQSTYISISRCSADISVDTRGYYVSDGWNQIASAAYVKVNKGDVEQRKYKCKQLLKVEIKVPEEDAGIVLGQMACLLQESFCTFYPQQHYLLSVAIKRERYKEDIQKEILNGVLSDVDCTEDKNLKCFYIIEDSMEDMGLVRSIERNFRRILDLLSDYMKWSKESNDDYFKFGKNLKAGDDTECRRMI